MNSSSLLIASLFSLAILLFIIGFEALIYQNSIKSIKLRKKDPNEWLFYHFKDKVYDALFGDRYPEDVARKFGIDAEEYYNNCFVIDENPDIKGLIVDYIYGFVFLIVNGVFGYLFSPIFYLTGTCIMYLLMMRKRDRVKAKAETKKDIVARDFPRFLSLLSAELDVGLPIDTAIVIISQKFDSILSKEFLASMGDVNLGVSGWQDALYKMADKYKLDMLTDFVLDITTSFDKGVSIAEAVRKRVKDSKNKRLYLVRERAARAENEILIPIALLQFIPMLLFILVPTLYSVQSL